MSERDQIVMLFVLAGILLAFCVVLALMGQVTVALSLMVVAITCIVVGTETRKKNRNG